MLSKRRFKVTIDGKDYTIIGKQTTEHIEAVVEMVNTQLSQLGKIDSNLSQHDRALLMAVNAISDQFLKEKQIIELEKEIARLKQKGLNPSSLPEGRSQSFEAELPYQRPTPQHKER